MKLWRSINKYSGRLVLKPIYPEAKDQKPGSKTTGGLTAPLGGLTGLFGGLTAKHQNRRSVLKTARDQNTNRSNFWFTRPNFTKLEPHLLRTNRNLFQSTIATIQPRVPTIFSLNEEGSKTRSNRKRDLATCSWVIDDQDDPRWVPTCHSKLDHKEKSIKNSRIKEIPKITKYRARTKRDSI